MKKTNKLVITLSFAPFIWVMIGELFPSLKDSTLILLLTGTTLVSFFVKYLIGKDSLGIGMLSALVVFLIGADRFYDYFQYDHGTLSSLAEAAAFLLCAVEYFHYFLRHEDQAQKIKELEKYKARCEDLERFTKKPQK